MAQARTACWNWFETESSNACNRWVNRLSISSHRHRGIDSSLCVHCSSRRSSTQLNYRFTNHTHTHRYLQNTHTQSTPKSIFAARNILYWMQLRLMIYEWTTVTLAASICQFENRNAFKMSFKWLDDSPHTNWNCSVSFRYWSLHSTRRYLAIIKNDFQATESIRVCGVCLCDGDGGHNQYSFVCVRRIQAPWIFSSFANGLSNTIYDRIVLNGDAVDVIWPFYFWPINTGECGGWPQFCLLFVLVATQCLCEWNTCGYRATNAPCNR